MEFDVDLLEGKLKEHRDLSDKIRFLEEKKKALSQELLVLLPRTTQKYQTPHFRVSRQERIYVKTSLEDARRFQAVKIEEVVDKDKLKSLHNSGTEVPGISLSEFILVNPKKQ